MMQENLDCLKSRSANKVGWRTFECNDIKACIPFTLHTTVATKFLVWASDTNAMLNKCQYYFGTNTLTYSKEQICEEYFKYK